MNRRPARIAVAAAPLAALLLAACVSPAPRHQAGSSAATPPAQTPMPPQEAQICTMDAKICPDGTAVGRTGPNCTFPPCPGS